jgi:carbamoyltransferase
MLRLARHAHRLFGVKHLCLAGGVALNCIANGRLVREGPFDGIWIQPAAGDSGGAVGAALLGWYARLDKPRRASPSDDMRGAFLGPEFGAGRIRTDMDRLHAVGEFLEDADLVRTVAQLLETQRVVGWFCGRMEFGPRSLGARSILADPRGAATQSLVNRKIKYREEFRPFAPAVLREHAADYFGLSCDSPYMLLVSHVTAQHRTALPAGSHEATGLDLLHIPRTDVPAVTHVDYSARVQTVDASRHGMFHALLQAFYERTGCPVLLTTSYNVRGEPIVCTPEDAYRCFMGTDIDALVLGNYLLLKEKQPDSARRGDHRTQFAPD